MTQTIYKRNREEKDFTVDVYADYGSGKTRYCYSVSVTHEAVIDVTTWLREEIVASDDRAERQRLMETFFDIVDKSTRGRIWVVRASNDHEIDEMYHATRAEAISECYQQYC